MPQMSVRPAAALAVAALLPLIAVAAPLARSPAQTGRAVHAYQTGPARPGGVGPGFIRPGPAWPGRSWPPARLGTT